MARSLIRLADALTAAGIPIRCVSDTDPIEVVFEPHATPGHKQQASLIIETFDWSALKDQEYHFRKAIEAAQDALENDVSPTWRAIRAVVQGFVELHNRQGAETFREVNVLRQAGGLQPLVRANTFPILHAYDVLQALKDAIEGDQAFPNGGRT